MHITKLFAVLVAILMTAVGLGPTPAAAHNFVLIKMDDRYMEFSSDEDNDDHFLFWNHFVYFQNFDEYDFRTDLYGIEVCRHCWNDGTDIVWFAWDLGVIDPVTGLFKAGDETCGKSLPPPNQVCDRARVRFNENLSRTISGDVGFSIACHEIGHAIGFDHSDEGCMPAVLSLSAPASNVLTTDMISHINFEY
jgi:hypothetical protein